MDKEESFISEIKNQIEIMNKLVYFTFLITDDKLELLSRESNEFYQKYLKEKFESNFKDIILKTKIYNTYPYI